MRSLASEFILAAAGSGKTTELLARATRRQSPALIVTYTNENLAAINRSISALKDDTIADRIRTLTWFRFVLEDAVQPYQATVVPPGSVKSINTWKRFTVDERVKFPERKTIPYYFDRRWNIYKDRATQFACKVDGLTDGCVARRILSRYSAIYIDEFQDITSRDLDFVELLIRSNVPVIGVGDPRQSTLASNDERKNKHLSGLKIHKWIAKLQKEGLVTVSQMPGSHRCCQAICDFADSLFAGFEDVEFHPTTSSRAVTSGHFGVHLVRESDFQHYVKIFEPQILTANKNSQTFGYARLNLGLAKGQGFHRVMIVPHQNVREAVAREKLEPLGEKTIMNLYVGVTRARESAAIVIDDDQLVDCSLPVWSPGDMERVPEGLG